MFVEEVRAPSAPAQRHSKVVEWKREGQGLISEALTSNTGKTCNWLLWKARSSCADSYGAWLPTCPSRDHRTQVRRLMKENKFNQKDPSGSREFVAHKVCSRSICSLQQAEVCKPRSSQGHEARQEQLSVTVSSFIGFPGLLLELWDWRPILVTQVPFAAPCI